MTQVSTELRRFEDALQELPDIAERIRSGSQFNAYSLDGGGAAVCVGPLTKMPVSLVDAPQDVADLLAAALRLSMAVSEGREATAWRWRNPGKMWNYQEDRQRISDVEQEPLFTTPPEMVSVGWEVRFLDPNGNPGEWNRHFGKPPAPDRPSQSIEYREIFARK